MKTELIITSVESLQAKINKAVKRFRGMPGVYVSLNKSQRSIEEILKKSRIDTKRIFFIDCITSENINDDVIHIPPTNLDELSLAIKDFAKEIKGRKFIIIDALSTLLIYNNENKVAQFVKKMTDLSSENAEIIAFSPKTKGEELLDKIFNFFDEVKRR